MGNVTYIEKGEGRKKFLGASMRVGLIGAGAVGAYFIWGFAEKSDIDFCVIADGERAERLKEKGIFINGKNFRPQIKTAKEAGELDIVWIATKYDALDSAIATVKEVAGEKTIVLSLLNGVDSEERIRAALKKGVVLLSVMRIASKRDAEGIHFNPEATQGVFFGADDKENGAQNEAVARVKESLEQTRINYRVMDDIKRDLWRKYASNIANNLPQAVLGTDASLYTESEHGLFLATKLWQEVRAVAKANGVELSEKPIIFYGIAPTSKFSTLQDLEAKRHTEIEMFAGHLMKLAEKSQIQVPYTEYTYHAIKALEEKNDGIIGC